MTKESSASEEVNAACPDPVGGDILKTDVLGRITIGSAQREIILDAFEASGMTGQAFALHHGIKIQTFASWIQKRRRKRGDYQNEAELNCLAYFKSANQVSIWVSSVNLAKICPDGDAPRVMTFDRLGRLLTAANAHAAITRTYDHAGRQLSETQLLTGGVTGTFQYEYDLDGNLKKHIRPDGSIVDYAWNARNLLAAVTSDGPPPVATYTYNGRNQISSTIVENGIFTANRTYDTAGRLTGVTNGAIENTGYTLSPDGRRTSVTRDGDVENYGYDNARQVTSASYGGLSTNQSWNYDAAGNRSTATTNGVTNNYVANSVNEYTSISGLPTNPAYDDNGNATTWNIRPPASGVLASAFFYWDINNQLVAATDNNTGDSASYQYDPLGRRTKRTEIVGGVATETWFFNNGWNVELERNATNFKKRMTWGLDLSQSLQGAGGVGGLVMVEDLTGGTPVQHFPTYDGNGNITAWVNASGTVVARQRYDAFGNIIAQTGTAPSNYGFSTKPMDQVTGLLYYGYRYYDPVTGRWPSRDPIEESGGVNLYRFVRNNGVRRIDMLGLLETTGSVSVSFHMYKKTKVSKSGYFKSTTGWMLGHELSATTARETTESGELLSTLIGVTAKPIDFKDVSAKIEAAPTFVAPEKFYKNPADSAILPNLSTGEARKKGQCIQCAVFIHSYTAEQNPDESAEFLLSVAGLGLDLGSVPVGNWVKAGLKTSNYLLQFADPSQIEHKVYMQMILCADGRASVMLGGVASPVVRNQYFMGSSGTEVISTTTEGIYASSSIDETGRPARHYFSVN